MGTRYTTVAIVLHWLIAAAILVNIGLGAWMGEALDSPQNQAQAIAAFQWHKSIGLTVLLFSLLRLAWRFIYPPPPLPAGMSRWERAVALSTHWAFYGLMIAIPLSGWIYVSAQWREGAPLSVPTLWFGLFEVPHLFGLEQATQNLRESTAEYAIATHALMVGVLLLLLGLHIAAALHHQFSRRDAVLARMLPGLSTPEPSDVHLSKVSVRGAATAAAVLIVAGLFIAFATHTRVESPARGGDLEAALKQRVSVEAGLPRWRVDADNSSIGFSGVHAGRPFKGRFGEWRAAIYFDPQAPRGSKIVALVKTASASDGVPMHDRTLPGREWFHSAQYPYATFRSTRIGAAQANRYKLFGALTIKNREIALAPLQVAVNGNTLRITGDITIDRAAVNMGMESDPGGQYVSRDIGISVDVRAVRVPG